MAGTTGELAAGGERVREENTLAYDTHSPGSSLANPRTAGAAPVAGSPDGTASLALTCRAGPDGQTVVAISGELDIVTADEAYAYVRDVIDQGAGSVDVDIAGLTFCDARGLATMARMARHAGQAGCQLRLAGTPPRVLKLMRITGFDRWHPGLTAAGTAGTGPACKGPGMVSSGS
jgi:anti-sigma B factor antagonist